MSVCARYFFFRPECLLTRLVSNSFPISLWVHNLSALFVCGLKKCSSWVSHTTAPLSCHFASCISIVLLDFSLTINNMQLLCTFFYARCWEWLCREFEPEQERGRTEWLWGLGGDFGRLGLLSMQSKVEIISIATGIWVCRCWVYLPTGGSPVKSTNERNAFWYFVLNQSRTSAASSSLSLSLSLRLFIFFNFVFRLPYFHHSMSVVLYGWSSVSQVFWLDFLHAK